MFKPPTIVSVDVVVVTMAKIGFIEINMRHEYDSLMTGHKFQINSHVADGNRDFSAILIVFDVYQVNSDMITIL